ncbi:MAG: zinc ribbon domain-containing protein [Oscillospiraceae bacterium]|nr:zinc ribbon domain-containing protein [Oscillospiraceae bacterium]
MKFCSKCGTQCEDFAAACPSCGNAFSTAAAPAAPAPAPAAAAPAQAPVQPPVAPVAPAPMPVAAPVAPAYDPKDHTAEFDAKDISDNKVVAMLPYLMGAIGLIIAILLANTSKYVSFHVRTALKFTVVETLLALLMIVPFLGWMAYGVCYIICLVLRIIAFFQVCKGKAKDPAIISGLGFLK